MRFDVQGVAGAIESAVLRLDCGSEGGLGGTIWRVSDTWTENDVTWNNKPALIEEGSTLGVIACNEAGGTTVDYDVSQLVEGPGAYAFMIISTSGDGITFLSKEDGSPPLLLINR